MLKRGKQGERQEVSPVREAEVGAEVSFGVRDHVAVTVICPGGRAADRKGGSLRSPKTCLAWALGICCFLRPMLPVRPALFWRERTRVGASGHGTCGRLPGLSLPGLRLAHFLLRKILAHAVLFRVPGPGVRHHVCWERHVRMRRRTPHGGRSGFVFLDEAPE